MKNGLFKNESIKIWSQTSNRVIVIILAVIIIFTPVVSFLFKTIFSGNSYGSTDMYENYLDMADRARSNPDVYSQTEAYYYEAEAASLKFFIDNNIADSWKYQVYFSEYSELMNQVTAYRLLAEGKFTFEELSGSYFGSYVSYFKYSGNPYTYDQSTGTYFYTDENGVTSPTNLTHADFYAYIKDLAKNTEAFILSTDFSGQLKNYADSCRAEYEAAAAEVTRAKTAFDAEPSNEELGYYYDSAKLRYESLGEKVRLADYLCDMNAEYGDWRYQTVTVLMSAALDDRAGRAIMPESLYLSNSYSQTDYKNYVSGQESGIKKAERAIAILNYSLEQDIPTPYSLKKSAKLSWQNNIPSAISYIRIFMIILAGTIVAGEFSSGSVRLLLTRPKKRSKILTSKLTAAAFWSFIVMLSAAAVLLVLNVITNGISDIFLPDLVYVGGKVVRVSGFLTALAAIFVASLPAFLLFSVAFLFSVLTRKSALAIALSLICSMLYSAVSTFSILLAQRFAFLVFTPLPYNDMTSLISSPVAGYAGGSGLYDSLSALGSYLFGNISLNFMTGVIVMIVYTAIMVYFSYLSFSRQQIKN
jgi:ABC-2 type transport system permease protein